MSRPEDNELADGTEDSSKEELELADELELDEGVALDEGVRLDDILEPAAGSNLPLGLPTMNPELPDSELEDGTED